MLMSNIVNSVNWDATCPGEKGWLAMSHEPRMDHVVGTASNSCSLCSVSPEGRG